MEGTITSFLREKGYGFIRGDDGRDYFAHADDFGGMAAATADGQRVSFSESATAKGYRARAIRLLGSAPTDSYATPTEVLVSRKPSLPGWEVIESSIWRLHGSSRESPEAARTDLLLKTARIGANGLVLLEYYRTRGAERGTRGGTYHYTIHNFRAYPVVVAKLSTLGVHRRTDLSGLGERITTLKAALREKTRSARNRAAMWAGIAFAPALLATAFDVQAAFAALAIGGILAVCLYVAIARDHDGWLEPPAGL